MTARRRSRRGRPYPALLVAAAGLGILAVVDVGRAVAWLLAIAAVGAIAWAVRRSRHPARVTGPGPVRPAARPVAWGDAPAWTGGPVPAGNSPRAHLRAVPDPEPELARLRAERDQLAARVADLGRQVAKLEDDAAAHDELLDRLEAVTGRPVEAVIASYQHAQRIYGPAAVGKAPGSQRSGSIH